MSSRRVLKAAEAIREVVSMTILTGLRDPRVANVTVTRVEVSPDMRNAKVHVSVMGSEAKQNLAIKGLESSAGYLQSKIGDRIDTRYTPKLVFKLDDGVKKSIAIAKMLAEVLPQDEPAAAGADAPSGDAVPDDLSEDIGGEDPQEASPGDSRD
ncbi:30S ribosome-binding factor RbfA [Botrimarina mediterranea]|uniref:Ribosome-binding factor A n=1 Tax=Botrimarina mediterranea TaxID=2528022 RepID=A0A518KCI8_9BACT|nr:30S ribosome-binding factor RbfA [Botrimarina mediterranea]QDV75513.1 Ribosome-binding factor A [Botrimarina mediterranea]QDV80146.1 Ribosome-binding factor A [Planctomycetes bacterium K2D]